MRNPMPLSSVTLPDCTPFCPAAPKMCTWSFPGVSAERGTESCKRAPRLPNLELLQRNEKQLQPGILFRNHNNSDGGQPLQSPYTQQTLFSVLHEYQLIKSSGTPPEGGGTVPAVKLRPGELREVMPHSMQGPRCRLGLVEWNSQPLALRHAA